VKIAFIGLGRMGRELVLHLLADGHDVTVWNRTASATQAGAQRGARVAHTAEEAVADAEVVVTTLFGPDTVRAVVTGADLPIPHGALWIDVTSVSPEDATSFADWAAARNIRFVHSPVVGSIAPARAGALGVIIGGDAEAVEAAKPIVSLWAAPDRVDVYDSPAKAATAKLVANLALGVAMQAFVESLRLGHAGGLSTEEVLGSLKGTALAGIRAVKGDVVLDERFADTQFSANLLHKDAGLMLRTSRTPLPAVTAVFSSLEEAIRAGRGEDDFSVIAADDR
jgi:3-hydroxyisobutyrate dehydrogenase